jgi:nucleotide-binding universal stress UspA family protein
MKRFKKILLVHERKPRGQKARDRAVDLAVLNNARIRLVEVAEPLPQGKAKYLSPDGEVDLQALVAGEIENRMSRFIEQMSVGGVEVDSRVLFGNPFIEIIREVHLGKHDLVLLTAEGDGGLKSHLFGSLSRHLLRKCPCPVWVVRPARRRKSIRVLAAVNPSETHHSARNLDRTILEMASSLARMYDGKLDIVHVWQQAPRSGRVHRNVVAKWNEDLYAAAEQRVAEMLEPFDFADLKPGIHLPGGPPGLRIVEVAEKQRVDVVVMGTLSRSGLQGMLMGNTCEAVLQQIEASILAVKPEGFVSPVKLDS